MKKFLKILLLALAILPIGSVLTLVLVGSMNGGASSNGGATSTKKDVDFSTLSYVAFGDSITYGADYTRNYGQMDDPYPELVAEELGLASYENRGISGATFCQNNVGRVCMTDNILAYKGDADIISVMLGVNDYAASLPLGDINDNTTDTIYGCLNLIAKHLTTNHKDAFVFFMTPYQTTIRKSNQYTLSDVAKAVKKVANLYDIPVLDMYSLGNYALEMNQEDSDGVHPSQEFIAEYTAPQIAEFLRRNYE